MGTYRLEVCYNAHVLVDNLVNELSTNISFENKGIRDKCYCFKVNLQLYDKNIVNLFII